MGDCGGDVGAREEGCDLGMSMSPDVDVDFNATHETCTHH